MKWVLRLLLGLVGIILGLISALIFSIDLVPNSYAWLLYVVLPFLFAYTLPAYFMGERAGKGKIGKMQLTSIEDEALLSTPLDGDFIRIATLRQSGNEDKVWLLESREAALHEVHKFFNRRDIQTVRVWKNSHTTLVVRIPFYQGKGSSEGRKLCGMRLDLVPINK